MAKDSREILKPGHALGLKKWGLVFFFEKRKQKQPCKNQKNLTKTQISIPKSTD
jgi:hypothetical protein